MFVSRKHIHILSAVVATLVEIRFRVSANYSPPISLGVVDSTVKTQFYALSTGNWRSNSVVAFDEGLVRNAACVSVFLIPNPDHRTGLVLFGLLLLYERVCFKP